MFRTLFTSWNGYEKEGRKEEFFPILDKKKSTEYEGVSKSFRTGRLEQELQVVQLSATGCSCIAIL
jgi:hypothetical protein